MDFQCAQCREYGHYTHQCEDAWTQVMDLCDSLAQTSLKEEVQNYDANYKIFRCTDHTDNGNKNAFLLHIGTNTNMSSYLHDLYKYDETEYENEYENEIKIYEALDLQMPTNMKHENMKMKAQNEMK